MRKWNKKYTDWEGRKKILFTDDIIVNVENPKELTATAKPLLELSDFIKVARDKIHI